VGQHRIIRRIIRAWLWLLQQIRFQKLYATGQLVEGHDASMSTADRSSHIIIAPVALEQWLGPAKRFFDTWNGLPPSLILICN
jgi:hypothetical protein